MSIFENSSYLLRTNPLLTGNVKIVIDSDSKLYLESFNANKILKKEKYKHFRLKSNEYYKEATQSFFNGLESNIIFDNNNVDDKSDMYNDYKYQFDDTYYSGAMYVEDNYYKEEYEYFAPLFYRKGKCPTNFIIFRLDDTGIDYLNFNKDILSKLKTVKLFDLTDKSDIGVWIKNNFEHTDYPNNSLYVNNSNNDLSIISGIDVLSGGYINKYVNIYDMQSKNIPIFKSEEFITNLWKDNNLLYPNILNFKFLFDDHPADENNYRKYTINRYMGFYLDKKEYVKSVSSIKTTELNIPDLTNIENISSINIPYIQNNTFVQEIDNRLYSFDPIKNGWKNDQNYYIEFKGVYSQIKRIKNNSNDYVKSSIIGEYLYVILSENDIVRDDSDLVNDINQIDDDIKYRVLITDLGYDSNIGTTYKYRIKINDFTTPDDILIPNYISSYNDNLIIFRRLYEKIIINNEEKWIFKIILDSIDNSFSLSDADIHLININNHHYNIQKNEYGYNIISDEKIILNENVLEIKKIGETKKYNIDVFSIYKCKFTDVKDFDFDRINTEQTKYEYENDNEYKEVDDSYFYAKSYSDKTINTYTLPIDKARRIPITDFNSRPLYLRDERGLLNKITEENYKDYELFLKDDNWKLYTGELDGQLWYEYDKQELSLKEKYYREDNYIYQKDDILIEFDGNADLYETLTWGEDGKSVISDTKEELPLLNKNNLFPVSSEYITSDELWEIENENLTNIWNKNQNICKWGALNSIGKNDYQYRLNYSLEFGDYNHQPNRYTTTVNPIRSEQNLDYFYRFGITNTYDNYSLHLIDEYFDIDKYLSDNYFETLFNSHIIVNNKKKYVKKYSIIDELSSTIFRGVKYQILNINDRLITNNYIDDIYAEEGNYNGYRFSIIFARKLSSFTTNNGNGDNNTGIDVYLNDVDKTILIHIYIDTDNLLTINGNNIETCKIDEWYNNTDILLNNIPITTTSEFTLYNFISILENYNYNPDTTDKNRVKFIHRYSDDSIKIMDYSDTDFYLNIIEPTEIIVDENAYKTEIVDVPDFEIYNSLDNRKVKTDLGITIDGRLDNSIDDYNAYNNYPIAKRIIENDNITEYWDLTDNDPSIYRFDNYYMPILKKINIFDNTNLRFDSSQYNFANIDEIIFSKCNEITNVLKIQNDDDSEKSIYPMVDEYGYDFNNRNILKSTWDKDYYYRTKRIEYDIPDVVGKAGYTVHLDGYKDYLIINDNLKFNQYQYMCENANYKNNIDNKVSGEGFNIYNIDGLSSDNKLVSKHINLMSNINNYKLTLTRLSYHPSTTPTTLSVRLTIKCYNYERYLIKTLYTDLLNLNSHVININTFEYNQNSTPIRLDQDFLKESVLYTEFIFETLTTNNLGVNNFELKIENLDTIIGSNQEFTLTNIDITNSFIDNNIFGYYLGNENILDNYIESEIITYTLPDLLLYAPSYRTYAGLETPKPGRIGVEPYDIINYPIPTNWNGLDYFNIISSFIDNAGTVLKDYIDEGNYEYSENYDIPTLYHFLEYGSQDYIETNNVTFNNIKIGYIVLNYFNAKNDLSFVNGDILRLTKNNFNMIEPEYSTKIDTGIGICNYSFNYNTIKPFVKINWFLNYNDSELSFILNNQEYTQSLYTNNNFRMPYHQISSLLTSQIDGYTVTYEYINSKVIFTIESDDFGSLYNIDFVLLSNTDFNIIENVKSIDYRKDVDIISNTEVIENRNNGYVGDITIEFWFKSDNWARNNETIIYKGVDSNINEMSYMICRDTVSDRLAFITSHKDIITENKIKHTLLSNIIEKDKWYHVACTLDVLKRTKKIYINGQTDATDTDFININIPEEHIIISEFLSKRNKFIYGPEHLYMLEHNVSLKFKNNVIDSETTYWYNYMNNKIQPLMEHKIWEMKNRPIYLNDAYQLFKNNYQSKAYYLNSDINNNYNIMIGSSSTIKDTTNWGGSIDELRIWNYCRTSNDIFNNYNMIVDVNSFMNPLKGLISYYRFDDGQELQKINDLTNRYVYKNFNKMYSNRKSFIYYDNVNYDINEVERIYYFEKDFYDDSFIVYDESNLDWDISGADIKSINNEISPNVNNIVINNDRKTNIIPLTDYRKRKREMSKILINTKELIFKYSDNKEKFDKWWKFKTPNSIKKQILKSNNIIKRNNI